MSTPLLSQVFPVFRTSLANSTGARAWLKLAGIDPKLADLGYIGKRFHHGKDLTVVNQCIQAGILVPALHDGIRPKVKEAVVFPLYNEAGIIVNYWLYGYEKGESSFINDEPGCYPAYPTRETQILFIAEGTIEAAIKQSTPKDTISVLSLENNWTEYYLRLIAKLPFLKTLILSSNIPHDTVSEIQQFIITHRPEIVVNASNDADPTVTPIITTTQPTVTEQYSPVEETYRFNTEQEGRLILAGKDITIEALGGVDNRSMDKLQLTLKAYHATNPTRSFRDTVNLYQHQQVQNFVSLAAGYVGIENAVLENALDVLVHKIEHYRATITAGNVITSKTAGLTQSQQDAALQLLQHPQLMEILYDDILGNSGIVGEEENRLIAFLVMTSRKLDNPLHLVAFGSTGMGKSHLIEMLAKCLPEDDYFELTSTSAKAFYHMKEYGLKHKLVLIQDLFDISPEVLYQIRELQSKKKLTRTITLKDKSLGFQTILKTIYGPTCIVASTTSHEIYPDNSNRSIEITMDESPEQDALILERQRKLAARAIDTEKEEHNRRLLQHCQQLTKTHAILNPYAVDLELPEFTFKKRRTQAIYLGLIEAITLLHQYQRTVKEINGVQHLITEPEDIRWANRLMAPILLRKSDMLNQASRTFFEELKAWATKEQVNEFTRKDMVDGLRKHPSAIKRHMVHLLAMDYIKILKGDRYSGHTYAIAEENEYTRLQETVKITLEESLQRIQAKANNVGTKAKK